MKKMILESKQSNNLDFHSGVSSGVIRAFSAASIDCEYIYPKPSVFIAKIIWRIYCLGIFRRRVPFSWNWIGLKRLFKVCKSDIILVHNTFSLNRADYARIVLYVDFLPSDFLSDYLLDSSSKLYHRLLARDLDIVKHSRAVVFRSQYYSSRWIERTGRSKSEVLALPCLSNLSFLITHKSFFASTTGLRDKSESISVGFIGKELDRKNFYLYAKFIEMRPMLTGRVVGISRSQVNLQPAVAARIEFLGFLSKQESESKKWENFFKSVDYGFVCPKSEAYGLQAVEFQMYGVPIITNLIGGLSSAILEGAYIQLDEATKYSTLPDRSTLEYINMRNACLKIWDDRSWEKVIAVLNSLL